jgi:hypothetical protein
MEQITYKQICFNITNHIEYLDITINLDNVKYFRTIFKLPHVDMNVVKKNLEEREYEVISCTVEKMSLKTTGGIIIEATSRVSIENLYDQIDNLKELIENLSTKTGNKPWILAGKLKNLEEILTKYPTTEFCYGMKYNSVLIDEIMISRWNLGFRVFFPKFYPHGDHAASFHSGTVVFTKNTSDDESKGIFYQRYVNTDFKPCFGSNGSADAYEVYVKLH